MAWFLAIPFFLLSDPSPRILLAGAGISLAGLLLRAWAAGSIHKDQELATGGVYGCLRHPLYVGSFLLGFGFALAGGRWWFGVVFLVLFFWLYAKAIREEEDWLEARFGEDYLKYRGSVRGFFPVMRKDLPGEPGTGFRLRLYRRNKEWQAALGATLGYTLLLMRMSMNG